MTIPADVPLSPLDTVWLAHHLSLEIVRATSRHWWLADKPRSLWDLLPSCAREYSMAGSTVAIRPFHSNAPRKARWGRGRDDHCWSPPARIRTSAH